MIADSDAAQQLCSGLNHIFPHCFCFGKNEYGTSMVSADIARMRPGIRG